MTHLGGFRHARADSINTAWKNLSFRGFADYMQTAEFARALHELISIAHHKTVAIMCSEAVPWHCHRSLIADALFVHGMPVNDIYSATLAKVHILTPWAVVHGTKVTYPLKD
jgi:uncharacterized protein (DUF488 family)